jgi:hypothetical protein
LESQDWARDDLVLPPWAQSDTTFDHFLEFGDNKPDFTPTPFNIGSSSLVCESQIDSDFPNSSEPYMLPESELGGAEDVLASSGNPDTVSKEREGAIASSEYELDRTPGLANLVRENVCRWSNCQSRFDQVTEFRYASLLSMKYELLTL